MKNRGIVILWVLLMIPLQYKAQNHISPNCDFWDTIGRPEAFVQDVLPYLDSLQKVNEYEMDSNYLEFYKYPVSYLDYAFYFYRFPFCLSHPQYGMYIKSKDNSFVIRQYNELIDTIVSFIKAEDFPEKFSEILNYYNRFPYNNETDTSEILYDQGSFEVMAEGIPFRFNEYEKIRVYYPIIHPQCDRNILIGKRIYNQSKLISNWQEFAFGHTCDYAFYLLAETKSFKICLLENQYDGHFAYSVFLLGDKVRIYEIEDMLVYYVHGRNNVLTDKGYSSAEYICLINDIISNKYLNNQEKFRLVKIIKKIRESIKIAPRSWHQGESPK